jgi:hypothetical protein
LWRDAAVRVIKARYGSEEAVSGLLVHRVARIVGLYYLGVFRRCEFDYTLTVPGEVVETNGVLRGNNRVRWQFESRDAYPLGYAMTCRSLEVPQAVQKDLLPAGALADREARLRFVQYVGGDGEVLQTLKRCREASSWKPLYAYRKGLEGKAPRAVQLQTLERLMRLLKLPDSLAP